MPPPVPPSNPPETPDRPDAEPDAPAVAGDAVEPAAPGGPGANGEAAHGEGEVPPLEDPDAVPQGLVVIRVSDADDAGAPPPSGPERRDRAWTPAPAPEPDARRRWLKYWPIPALIIALLVLAWVWPEPVEPLTEDEIARLALVERNAHTRSLQASPVRLDLGTLATGALEVNDGYGPGGRYEDYYAVEVADSVTFDIVLTSDQFDPELEVLTPTGDRLAATNLLRTDVQAVVPGLQGPGRFAITVTSMAPEQRGTYELSAALQEPLEPIDEFDEALRDTLGGGVLRAGRYSERFALLFDPEKPALIRVTAAFQPRLYMLGPEGEVEAYWRTVETVDLDSLKQTVYRFEPGWELPYTLVVTSEEAGARGPFTVEVLEAEPVQIPTNGRFIAASLGELSWLEEGRYLDRYLFRASARDTIEVTVRRAEDFVPTIRVFRGDRTAVEQIGRGSGATAQFVADASAEFLLEVSSEEEAMRGDYQVAVERAEAPPPPRATDDDDAPAASSGRPGPIPQQVSGFRTSRTGTTGRGYQFEVMVTAVDVRWTDGRIRVAVSIAERSVDFTGGWDVWWRRVARSYLTDNAGRQYSPSLPETRGGSAGQARPGSVRAGTAVFYAPASDANATTLTLNYPIGGDGSRLLQIPIPIRR